MKAPMMTSAVELPQDEGVVVPSQADLAGGHSHAENAGGNSQAGNAGGDSLAVPEDNAAPPVEDSDHEAPLVLVETSADEAEKDRI